MTFTKICLAVALIVTISGCQPGNGTLVPDTLIGVWKTADPKYADRFIEIKSDAIIFGTGGETFELHAIVDVDDTRDGKSTLYTISHINHHGQRYLFSFYYSPSDGGTMRFKNRQHIIWTKEKQ